MTETQTRKADDVIYKIKNGFCMIINIMNFDEREDLKRNGSEESVKLIKEAFEQTGFNVIDYVHLTDAQILNKIDQQINKDQCKPYDAFVLYIHSHGIQDTILCKNNQIIQFYQIIQIFKDDNSENWKNKPKMMVFDCCKDG